MVRPRAERSAVVASADAVRAVVVRQQVARWVAVENWRVAPSSSSQEEEEIPAHPKEEEDASMQHVESGWTLVSDRRRREWVSTHPAGGW